MQLTALRSEVRRLLGNITTGDYSNADINTALNKYFHTFVQKAIMASGSWRVSGEIATANLVAGQAEYPLPTTDSGNNLITLDRIEVNLTGVDEEWSVAKIIDDYEEKNALSNTNTDFLNPCIYLHNGSFFFLDAPTTSVTGGIKMWYSTEPTELSGDTDEMFLPEALQHGVIYGACFDFAMTHKLYNEVNNFRSLLNEKLSDTAEYYANRSKVRQPRIVPRTERYA